MQYDQPVECDVRLVVAVAALIVSFSSWLIVPRITRNIVVTYEREKFRTFIDILAGKIGRFTGESFAFTRHPDWPGMKGMIELESRTIDVTPRIRKKHASRFIAALEAYRSIGFHADKPNECEAQRLELL